MNLRIPYAVIYIPLYGSKTQFEYDANGETVMEYSYDPWGNIEYHLSETFDNEQDAMLFTAVSAVAKGAQKKKQIQNEG